ncbi:MAG: hypothetical protein R2822_01730 [Spirosomataceae bacterium]
MYRSNNQVLLFLALAYIGWYFYYLHRYIVDMPYIDDYDAILGYILQFRQADFWATVQSLVLPHNEHIMTVTRLVSWCNVALTGTIDFYGLIIIGNGLLLWQLWLLYTLFRTSENIPSVYFLLVILIFLNPQYSPTSFWAMALWSNIWVLIPVTLSIFFLSNPKTWFWALPMALLALFGNGNGLFIWPVGLAILFLAKRPLFQYMVWGITGGIFCSIYFYLMRQQPSSGMFELSHLSMVPLNTLAFVGAYFALVSGKLGQTIAILAGTSILILGFFTLKKYLATKQKADLILLSLLVFIFLTALAVALFRAEKGMGIIIGGRYRQYSSLAVGIGFLIAIRHFPLKGKSRIQLLLWVAVSTITCLSFFRDVGLRRATEERTVADYHNILHNGIDVYTTTGTPRFVKTAREARQLAIYMAPPKYDLTTHLKVAALIH